MLSDECPTIDKQVCFDVGAFVKTEPPTAAKQQETAPAEIKAEIPVMKPPPVELSPPMDDEPDPYRPMPPQTETFLPGLRPGPDGKIDWTPLGKMTGTRPEVNKYSNSRYSLTEWRKHNEQMLNPDVITESNIVDYNARTSMMQAFGNVDKEQSENNKRLRQKAKDIFRWKVEVEKAVKAITDEVELLEFERQRIKGATRVLMLPESISKECLNLRGNRSKLDLVADMAEEELIKEMNMVNEVRAVLKNTLLKIEEQMAINKAAKHRIEYDWCDKKTSYETETLNIALNPRSNLILFRPGATRYGDNTAPVEYWEYFCREIVQNTEAVRQKSADLRGTLNAILISGGRKLRNQADRTDMALAETIAITQELCTKLEENLRTTLQKLADMENLIDQLQESVRKMDGAMKLAQTRLENRNINRPHGENVRDLPHQGLIGEVKKIHETVTSLMGQLKNAERVREELTKKRYVLEKEIASKRMTLSIDRDRCGMVRLHYPSASELAGY